MFERVLSDPAALAQVLERELAHGGAFVPTGVPPGPLSRVAVRLVLPDGASAVVPGTAVNVLGTGFFVQFDRGPALDSLLSAARAALLAPEPADEPAAFVPTPAEPYAAVEEGLTEESATESPSDEAPTEEEERLRVKSAWDLIDTASSVPVHRQVAALAVADRLRLARYATRPVRQVLVRDVEKRIHLEVAKNPKTTDSELEEWAAMPGLSPEALRWISTQKRLISRLPVQVSLIENPGTPQDIALRLVAALPIGELHRINRSTKVREAIRRVARRRLMESGNL